MIIDDYRVPQPEPEKENPTRISIFDKQHRLLGSAIIDDPLWQMFGRRLCLDTAVDIPVTDRGRPYYCSMHDALYVTAITFKLAPSSLELSPGDSIYFSRHDLFIEFEHEPDLEALENK